VSENNPLLKRNNYEVRNFFLNILRYSEVVNKQQKYLPKSYKETPNNLPGSCKKINVEVITDRTERNFKNIIIVFLLHSKCISENKSFITPGLVGGKTQMRSVFNEATKIILIFDVRYLINIAGPHIKEILVKVFLLSYSRIIRIISIAFLAQCG
jgi:hypothetical protein